MHFALAVYMYHLMDVTYTYMYEAYSNSISS